MLTFETKCYEKDWAFILGGNRLETMIRRCHHAFAERVLYINNVQDPGRVQRAADRQVKKGVIDRHVLVAPHAEAALAHFGLQPADFNGGYYYSIAELVGLYLCKTPYLLHFSGDAMLQPNQTDWIGKAITLMEANPAYMVANALWDNHHAQAAEEAEYELPDFYVGYGFSDQNYLVSTALFRQPIYGETHTASARYPAYGGELFEKRVDSYLRNHGGLRLTSKEASYRHRNFPTTPWARFRLKYLGR